MMKPFSQWTPDEWANLDASLQQAGVNELIGALATLSGFGNMQPVETTLNEASRRRFIRLLAARLAVRTGSPEYV
jgi:hypothetical protein